jgi:predicted DCC family thiol-disulfide oxidoreductase YuxK
VNTEKTVSNETIGWIFYDANCSLCARSAVWFNRMLDRRGFRLLPLQTPGVADRVGVTSEALFARMHLLKRDGRRFAGADAFVEIARHVKWARLIVAASKLPGVLPVLRHWYDWIAAHRYCLGGTCRPPRRRPAMDWLPLIVLPVAAFAFRNHLANWVLIHIVFIYLVVVYALAAWKGGRL